MSLKGLTDEEYADFMSFTQAQIDIMNESLTRIQKNVINYHDSHCGDPTPECTMAFGRVFFAYMERLSSLQKKEEGN